MAFIGEGSNRAWVNFKGGNGNVVGINDDYNVSSITHNATGHYFINFDGNFSDTNYCMNGTATEDGTEQSSSDGGRGEVVVVGARIQHAVGQARIFTITTDGTSPRDCGRIEMQFTGDR